MASVTGTYGVPGYTGDDAAIVYSTTDPFASSGLSLWRQSMARDRITPRGSATPFLSNADFGVIYRRGTFAPPQAKISVPQDALSFGEVLVGDSSNPLSLTVSNIGTADLRINTVGITGTNASEFSFVGSGCARQTLAPSGRCNVSVVFSPRSAGGKGATLSIQSDDPDTPTVTVQLSGTALVGDGGNGGGGDGNGGGDGGGGGCFIAAAARGH